MSNFTNFLKCPVADFCDVASTKVLPPLEPDIIERRSSIDDEPPERSVDDRIL